MLCRRLKPRVNPPALIVVSGSAGLLTLFCCLFVVWCRRFLTLPQPPGCSTISAGRLSFRVRNGSGRFPAAIGHRQTSRALFLAVGVVSDTV